MTDKIPDLYEKVGQLRAAIDAQHSRQDRMETAVVAKLDNMEADLKKLIAKDNRQTGYIAALVLIATVVIKILEHFWR